MPARRSGVRSIRNTTPSQPPRFSPWTLAFRDRRLEALFVVQSNRRVIGPVRWLGVFFVAVTAIMAVFEIVVDSPTAYSLLPWRVLGIVATLAGIRASLRWTWPTRYLQIVLAGLFVLLHAISYGLVVLYGPYVLAAVPSFLMALAMTLVLPALVFRLALPIAGLATLGYARRMVEYMPGVTYTVPIFYLVATVLVLVLGAYASERGRRVAWAASRALAREKARSEELLLNVLPPSIAERMSAGERLIADTHESAAILFADIVGFTPLSRSMPPNDLVALLDRVFTAFDAIAERHNLEKIKTIGDSYMLAAGAPVERPAEPERICRAALEMRDGLAEIVSALDAPLAMRIGIHCGPVVAGVIGRRKFIYDIWGDTVNTASRMESTAPHGAIQVTGAVVRHVAHRFTFEPRGEIEVKGLGRMEAFLVIGAPGE